MFSKCKGKLDLGLCSAVHDFGTCKENAAAQCRLPTNYAAKHVLKSEVGTVQSHSPCKYRSHAQT